MVPSRAAWLVFAGAIGLLAALYFGGLADDPFDGDDDTYLRDSAQISEDFSALLFPSRYPGRPLVNLVFWLGYELWGESPGAFHLLVVAVHVAVSLLLARLVMSLGGSRELGFLSGLLFLVNASHFRAIQWISAIAYPLMFALGIIAILCCLRYMASRQTKFLAATYGALLLAVLAHQAAIALWIFCLYLCWSREHRLRGTWLRLLPLGGLLLLVIAGVVYLYPEAPPVAVAARFPTALELAQNLLWFLSRLFTTAYWIAWPIYRYAAWELWVGMAALAGLALLLFRGPALVASWAAWTLITLLPCITPAPAVLRDLPQGGPSRFLYLASAGTAVLAAWGLLQLAGRVRSKAGPGWGWAAMAGLAGALAVSGFIALKRAEVFTLYTSGRNHLATSSEQGVVQLKRAVATHDSLIVPLEDAYVRLCLHLLGTDEAAASLAEALRQFPANTTLNVFKQVSVSLGPDADARRGATLQLQQVLSLPGGAQPGNTAALIAQSYGIMALNLSKRGDLPTAVAGYQQALAFDPADPVTWANLGTTLKQLGRLPEALQAYGQAIQRRANDPALYHNLGAAAQQQGDRQTGIRAFERAAALGSDNIETYLGLSQLYQENGQLDEGLRVYSQILALDLKGGNTALYTKMGTDLFQLGKFDESTTAYRKALAADSANLVAHVNLGWNLYLKGQVQEAISHYHQALTIQPTSQAQFNLGLAYLRLGQLDQARQTYAEGIKTYGADEARQVGAVDDLKQLITQGVQATEAKQLLDTYWQ